MKTELMQSKNPFRRQEENRRTVTPPAAIHETEKDFVVELDMPGLAKENIEISLSKDGLTITGRRYEAIPKSHTAVFQERAPFDYQRTFSVNAEIKQEDIKAAYENGVLTVTLPKSEHIQPKRITVQ